MNNKKSNKKTNKTQNIFNTLLKNRKIHTTKSQIMKFQKH